MLQREKLEGLSSILCVIYLDLISISGFNSLRGCLSLYHSPKKSGEGNCDHRKHQSIESAKVVRVPTEEIRAEQHSEHVDCIVVSPQGGTMERSV